MGDNARTFFRISADPWKPFSDKRTDHTCTSDGGTHRDTRSVIRDTAYYRGLPAVFTPFYDIQSLLRLRSGKKYDTLSFIAHI